jgi:hypothetical protein
MIHILDNRRNLAYLCEACMGCESDHVAWKDAEAATCTRCFDEFGSGAKKRIVYLQEDLKTEEKCVAIAERRLEELKSQKELCNCLTCQENRLNGRAKNWPSP